MGLEERRGLKRGARNGCSLEKCASINTTRTKARGKDLPVTPTLAMLGILNFAPLPTNSNTIR